MKASELRELGLEGLEKKLTELKEQHFNLRFQNGTDQLENTAQLPRVKKEIARVKTLISELQTKNR